MIVLGIIIGLIVLMALVTIHEFGHFLMAKKNGVRVLEFGIGFPPKAAAWLHVPVKDKDGKIVLKKNGKPKYKWEKLPKSEWDKKQKYLIFSINYLPIGGFCQMDGESDDDERKGTFGAASFWGKTKILFGGVLFNWLSAFVILTVLAWTGMPHFVSNQFTMSSDTQVTGGTITINEVKDGTAAKKAGLEKDDVITAVGENDQKIATVSAQTIIDFNNEHKDQDVYYYITRNGEEKKLSVHLGNDNDQYVLGIAMAQNGQALYRSTWSAPIVGAVTTVQLTGETFKGLGTMVYNFVTGAFSQLSTNSDVKEQGKEALAAAGDSVSGPVGIIGVIFPAFTQAGPTNIAFLAALIAVSLACMNVLPIPALDGGRWLLIAIYRLRGKKISKETEAKIVSRAFIVLLAMIAIITILDITKLFR